jgi:hypothetical protein
MGAPLMSPLARRTLLAVGSVACVAGTRAVVVGAAEVPSPGNVSATVDSEYRFYAAWYPIVGVAALRASRGHSLDDDLIPGVSAGLLLAAAGRLLSIRRYGRPHGTQLALLGLELAVPALLLSQRARGVDRGVLSARRGGRTASV